jgi:hypothetical protein
MCSLNARANGPSGWEGRDAQNPSSDIIVALTDFSMIDFSRKQNTENILIKKTFDSGIFLVHPTTIAPLAAKPVAPICSALFRGVFRRQFRRIWRRCSGQVQGKKMAFEGR